MFSPWARLSFAVFAVSWGANQFAPMQLVYREHLGLGSGSFAAMLGSYIIGLIPALLYFGRVADRIGRRPVILAMVPVSIVSSVVLLLGAELPLLLYLGRILAGLASGMAFGAGTAWMKELSADAGAGVGARRAAVSLSAGFGCGALFAGFIAQWLPAPEVLAYLVHIGLMVVALTLAWSVPDGQVPRAVRVRGGSPCCRTHVPVGCGALGAMGVRVRHGIFCDTSAPRVRQCERRVHRVHGHDRRAHPAHRRADPALGAAHRPAWRDGGSAHRSRDRRAGIRRGRRNAYAGSPWAVAVIVVAAVLLGAGYGILLISGLVAVENAAPADELAQSVAVFYCLIYLGFAVPFAISLAAPHIGFGACFAAAAALMCAALIFGRRVRISPSGREHRRAHV